MVDYIDNRLKYLTEQLFSNKIEIMKDKLIESRYLESSKLHLSDIFKSTDRKTIPTKSTKMEFLQSLKQKLARIKLSGDSILQEYHDFRDNTLTEFNIAMGKFLCSHTKLLHKKIKIEDQLEKSKENQNKMKAEVLQLRQMIQEFLKEYNHEISSRDRHIAYLTDILNTHNIYPSFKDIQSVNNTEEEEILDPILEESEYTASNATSKITLRAPTSNIPTQTNRLNQFSRSSSKRAKDFIGDFRKTIEESIQTNSIDTTKKPQFPKTHFANEGLKKEKKRETEQVFNQISKSSSSNQLVVLGEIDRINIPLKCQSPKNMMFLKKRSKRIFTQQNRMSTEGSEMDKQNIQVHSISRNSSQQRSQIFRGSVSGNSQTRRNPSKEKIKVTCKIIQEFNCAPKRKHKRVGSVHLGNKNYINKIKTSIKNAFQKYEINLFKQLEQINYMGPIIKSMKHGFGRVLYRNGMIFQGNFYNNERHGKGRFTLANQVIFQGEWERGAINGKGEVQTLKYLCSDCPQILLEAGFIGQFKGDRFHGNGTILLNKKEKILTQFQNGIPFGQFSLHSEDSIDFGFWKQ